MTHNSMWQRSSVIGWSLVWAIAMIATAFIFKGTPAKDWIESALMAIALACLLRKDARLVCLR